MAFGVRCHILYEIPEDAGRKDYTRLAEETRFRQCPAHRHARARWQNQESAHILSDSISTLCHSRMTDYYAISRLVNCYNHALKSFRSVYRLAISIWCCLLILHSVGQKWPAAVTIWPMTLGAVVGEDELSGAS